MFCKNCGNQVGEGGRFCSKCGAEILAEKKENLCPRCHVVVEEGAKFCNKCGASLDAPAVVACPSCGKALESGEAFCKFCGKGAAKESKIVDQAVQWIHKISEGKVDLAKYFGSSAEPFVSLRMKHMIAGWALAVLALFCLIIPVVAVEVPIISFLSSDENKTINISLIGLLTVDSQAAEVLEVEVLAGMFAFLSFVEMLIIAGASFYMLRPVYNGQIIKRRMFVLPIYAVLSSIFGMFSQLSLFQEACDAINRSFGTHLAGASLTFFGVLSLLIHIGTLILVFAAAQQNKKIVRQLSGGLI